MSKSTGKYVEEEVYLDIPNYEGLYQVSNRGNVRSLDRYRFGAQGSIYLIRGKMLSPRMGKPGYLKVSLSKKGVVKTFHIHQLVAVAFLNHIPCQHEIVVNHIDFNKTNNHVSNLELISSRENSNKKHLKSTSKYVGVSWNKKRNKWQAYISIGRESKYLGLFQDEGKANLAYQNALKSINNVTAKG